MAIRSWFVLTLILWASFQSSAFAEGDEGYFLNTTRWTSNRVSVCWENGSAATATEQGWVRDRVLQTWDASSSIALTGWGNCTATGANIRIVIQDAGPRTLGLGNSLNNVVNGMLVNFTFSSWGASCASSAAQRRSCIETIAIHEFGHALGIAHEHNRPDTDRSLCTDAPQGTNGDVIIGPFDNSSVMNYCFNSSFSNALSATDRATIQSMYPRSMIDMNGDGRTDVALTSGSGWGSIPVAFSTGAGSFNVTNASVAGFPGWAQHANARVASGDFNNDGLSDLALTGPTGWASIPVAFSNGNGTFNVTNSTVSSFPGFATAPSAKLFTGDFNGDGFTDLSLVGGTGWASIPVAFSNGNGTFNVTNSSVVDFPSFATTAGVKIFAGDYNGDGRTDFAATGPLGWASVPVAFSNGNGTFSVTNFSIASFASWAASPGVKVVSGDFNADGRTDLAAVGGSGWLSVPVAFSNGNGTFNVTNGIVDPSFNGWSTTAGARLEAADVNGDFRTDLVLTGPAGWASLPTAFAQGNGTWVTTNRSVVSFPSFAATAGASLIVGDFDRTRFFDLGVIGPSGWASLPVAFSTGGGFFSTTNNAIANFASWATHSGVVVIKQNR